MPSSQYTIHVSPISIESVGLKPIHRYAMMVDYRGGSRQTIGNGVAVAEASESGTTHIAHWAPNPDFSTSPNYTPIRVTLDEKKVGKEIEIIVLEGGPRGATGVKPKTAGEFRIDVGDHCDIGALASIHRIITIPCSIEGHRAIVKLQLAVHPTGRQVPPMEVEQVSVENANAAPEGKTIINGTAAAFLVAKGLFPANFAGKEIMIDSDVADEILKLLPPSKGGIRPQQAGASSSGGGGDSGPLETVFDLNDPAKKAEVGPLITALNRDAKAAESELNRARYDRIYTSGKSNNVTSILKHRDGGDRSAALRARIQKLEIEERAVKNRMVELESEQHVRDVTIDACAALERIGAVQEELQKLRKHLTGTVSAATSDLGIHDLARDIVAAQREIAILEWQSRARNILVHLLSGGGDLSPDWALLVSEPHPPLEIPTDLPELIAVKSSVPPQTTATATSAKPAAKGGAPNSQALDALDDFFGAPTGSPTAVPASTTQQKSKPTAPSSSAPVRQASTDLFASWEVVNDGGGSSSTTTTPAAAASSPVVPEPVVAEPTPPREPSTLDDARPVQCEFEGSLAKPVSVMDFDGQQTLHVFEGVVTNLEAPKSTSPGIILRFVTPQRPGIKAGTSVSSALKSLSWYLEVDDIFSSDKIAVSSAVTHLTHGRVQKLALLLREDELNSGAVQSLHNLSLSKSGGDEESVLLLQPMEGNRLRGTTYNLIVTATLSVGTPATRRVALKF